MQEGDEGEGCPQVSFQKKTKDGMAGEGLIARIEIHEGETVSFVVRNDLHNHTTGYISTLELDSKQHDTQMFWHNFIRQSKYKGRWREVVSRSLMFLKLMTYGMSLYSETLLGQWFFFCVSCLMSTRANRRHSCVSNLLHPRRYRRCKKLGLSVLLGPGL